MVDGNGNVVVTPYPRSFRVLSLTMNWTAERTTWNSAYALSTNTYAILERTQGYATWCNPDLYPLSSSWNPYLWPLADASQAYEYQQTGTQYQVAQIFENYVGPDALILHRPRLTQPDRRDDVRFLGAVQPGNDARYWFPYAYAFLADSTLPSDTSSCNATQNYTGTSQGFRREASRRIAFAQNATGGAYQLTTRDRRTDTLVSSRYLLVDTSVTVGWTVQLLQCTTGGDPTGSLIGEPGCSNCFDPSKLEPM